MYLIFGIFAALFTFFKIFKIQLKESSNGEIVVLL